MQIQVLQGVFAMGAAPTGVPQGVACGCEGGSYREAGGLHHRRACHRQHGRPAAARGRDQLPVRAQEAALQAARPCADQGACTIPLINNAG